METLRGRFGGISRTRMRLLIKGSEDQLERKLDGARPANLVKRTKTAASQVPATEALSKHLVRQPESPGAEESIRLAKIRMIQDIEQFCPKLQADGFVNGKVAVHVKVPLYVPKPPQTRSTHFPYTTRVRPAAIDRTLA